MTQHHGYSTENGSQMDATRRRIYQMADLIFSSSNSDIKYFLGESSDSPEVVKGRYGSLKDVFMDQMHIPMLRYLSQIRRDTVGSKAILPSTDSNK